MPKSGATNQARPVEGQPMWSNVRDLEADDVTASELAVDGEIEHSEIACLAFDL